jgi:hypothetical protein
LVMKVLKKVGKKTSFIHNDVIQHTITVHCIM